MQAENLVVDQGSERKIVEEVGEVLPDIGVAVFSQAFVVEAIDLRDLSGFVVAAENRDSLRIADLEGDEEGYGLDGIVATIYIVSYSSCQCDSVLQSCFDVPIKR